MELTILRMAAIELMESGEPFDLEFVTANRRKGTGGDLIEVKGWMKVSYSGDTPAAAASVAIVTKGTSIERDPHHREHGTVNIFNPEHPQLHPHKVHYDLIQFLNGKRVIN
jgi:hypothetical protein